MFRLRSLVIIELLLFVMYSMQTFQEHYQAADILLVDDVQLLEG